MNDKNIRWQVAMARVGRLVVAIGICLLVGWAISLNSSFAEDDDYEPYPEYLRKLTAFLDNPENTEFNDTERGFFINWDLDNPRHVAVLNRLIPAYKGDVRYQNIVISIGLRLMDESPEWHQFIMDWRLERIVRTRPAQFTDEIAEFEFKEGIRGWRMSIDNALFRRAKENPSEQTFADMRAMWKMNEFPTESYLAKLSTMAGGNSPENAPFKAFAIELLREDLETGKQVVGVRAQSDIAQVLVNLGDPKVIAIVEHLVDTSEDEDRMDYLSLLVKQGQFKRLEEFLIYLEDGDAAIREIAKDYLQGIDDEEDPGLTDQKFGEDVAKWRVWFEEEKAKRGIK